MSKPHKEVPRFASEAEERAFWESHDSTDYVDWSKARRAQPMHSVHDPGAQAVRELEAYYRRLKATRLPNAPELTEAEIAEAIKEVRRARRGSGGAA